MPWHPAHGSLQQTEDLHWDACLGEPHCLEFKAVDYAPCSSFITAAAMCLCSPGTLKCLPWALGWSSAQKPVAGRDMFGSGTSDKFGRRERFHQCKGRLKYLQVGDWDTVDT